MRKIIYVFTILLSLGLSANEIKPFSFNGIELGSPADPSWGAGKIKDVDVIRRHIGYTLNLEHDSPFKMATIAATLNDKKVYRIRVDFKDKYFKSGEECTTFMQKIIKNIKSKHHDIRHSDATKTETSNGIKNERYLYFLFNSSDQGITLWCNTFEADDGLLSMFKKKRKITTRINTYIQFNDMGIERLATEQDEEKSAQIRIKKEKEQQSKIMQKTLNESNGIDMFK